MPQQDERAMQQTTLLIMLAMTADTLLSLQCIIMCYTYHYLYYHYMHYHCFYYHYRCANYMA